MTYDAVIVGSGPSGSTAAKIIAEKGYNILLLEKEKFPREKPCGGGLPIRVLEEFNYLKKENIIDSYTFGGYAYSSSLKYTAKIKRKTPILAMVIRKKFDNELVKIAIDKGAKFKDSTQVKDIKIKKENTLIIFKNGQEIKSKIIIGADGVNSIVAKKTGLRTEKIKTGICVYKEIKLDEKIIESFYENEKYCHLHTRFQKMKGYGWVFPKKDHVNIGIAEINLDEKIIGTHIDINEMYMKYLNILKKQKIIPKDLKISNPKGGLLPIYPLKKTYTNRVLLTGDAGGFSNPVSGEGIYYAMKTAKIAAEITMKALKNEQYNEEFLSYYQDKWRPIIGDEIKLLIKMIKRQKEKPNENIIKYASKDPILANLMLGTLTGKYNIDMVKNQIIKRYLIDSIKYRFI